MKKVLFAALAALFLLHNDLWLWNDARRLLKLPVGLTYHVFFCIAAAIVMTGLAFFAWPQQLEGEDTGAKK